MLKPIVQEFQGRAGPDRAARVANRRGAARQGIGAALDLLQPRQQRRALHAGHGHGARRVARGGRRLPCSRSSTPASASPRSRSRASPSGSIASIRAVRARAAAPGSGLAIVKHALQRHEGELSIVSREGEGSTFSCRFPTERVVFRSDAVRAVL